MARGRHSLNPAKVKADARALEVPTRTKGLVARLRLRRRPTVVLLGLLSVVLLELSFAPWDCWFFAYVALVPWTLSLLCGPTRRWALLWAWLTGLVFWGVSLYWLTWITLLGYTAGILYLSLYWLLAGALLRAALVRRWPMWIVLPVVWVALEYVRAYAIGFPWFYLAHTQYARTALIQIADITGQYGVSFFVAMVNGLVIDVVAAAALLRPPGKAKLRPRLVRRACVVGATAVVLLGYGAVQLLRETREEGPVIGIVQEAFPIALGQQHATPKEVLDKHVAATRKFIGSDVELVVWAETMLPRGLNHEVLEAPVRQMSGDDLRALGAKLLGPVVWEGHSDETIRAYLDPFINSGEMPNGEKIASRLHCAERVGALAGQLGCPILAGGATIHRNAFPISAADRWVVRNGAIWFDPPADTGASASRPVGRGAPTYAKMHLVPFSEYVPFKYGWTDMHKFLRRFVPPVMEQLDPGTSVTRFELRPRREDRPTRPATRPETKAADRPKQPRTWRLVSPICYEGTFARICRRMVHDDGRKKADILVNLSNDGWFIWARNPKLVCRQCGKEIADLQATQCPRCGSGELRTRATYHRSTEQAQHLAHYCFRAVESRVPVVRAVNTGISASIDSNGRIVAEVRPRTGSGIRTMFPGTLLLDGAAAAQVKYPCEHGPKVLVDQRVSWYSRLGDSFALAVLLAAIVLGICLAREWLKGKWQRARKRLRRKEGARN